MQDQNLKIKNHDEHQDLSVANFTQEIAVLLKKPNNETEE